MKSDGKTAIVTGACGDIGRELVAGLYNAGYHVLAADKNKNNLETLQEGYDKERFNIEEIDITDELAVTNLFEKSIPRTLGRLDLLVNGAGILVRAAPHLTTFEQWRSVMSVNVDAAFLCARAAGRMMLEQEAGTIINVASTAATKALDGRVAYCSSKAAISHMTRVMALEWGALGIRVNALAPGFILSAMNADLRKDPKRYEDMTNQVPMRRFGLPSELVGPLLFLASDAASYVNGHILVVDGGLLVT